MGSLLYLVAGLFSIYQVHAAVTAPKVVGFFGVHHGAAPVRYFTTAPGGKGKPGTVVFYVYSGQVVPIIDVFDWVKVDNRLKGCHEWLRVSNGSTNGWVYAGMSSTTHRHYKIPQQTITNTAPDFLISDADFTQSYKSTIRDKFRIYKNRLTVKDWQDIFEVTLKYQMNPLVLLTKLEQEQSLITDGSPVNYSIRYNKACGVHGTKTKYLEGFKSQLDGCCRILRRHFNAWKPGKPVLLASGEGVVIPSNAATYALYVYTPHYGKYDNGGVPNIGNQLFVSLYKEFVRAVNK